MEERWTVKNKSTKRRSLSKQGKKRSTRPSEARLDAMVREAVVDCYDEEEQTMGLLDMLQENLILPFETRVLGMPVEVVSVEIVDRDRIIAMCKRGGVRQAISLEDLPLPTPAPEGAEWIEAYRYWSCGG
jgi:hypothetical protein